MAHNVVVVLVVICYLAHNVVVVVICYLAHNVVVVVICYLAHNVVVVVVVVICYLAHNVFATHLFRVTGFLPYKSRPKINGKRYEGGGGVGGS